MRSAAGDFPATEARDELQSWWCNVMDDHERLQGPEFDNAVAWAIAQVNREEPT